MAGDGHVVPLRRIEVPELNAPYTASWDDFLRQRKVQLWLSGGLARGLGLFASLESQLPRGELTGGEGVRVK